MESQLHFIRYFGTMSNLFYFKSLNYSFENEGLTTLQKQGIISLLRKKDKHLENLKKASVNFIKYGL